MMEMIKRLKPEIWSVFVTWSLIQSSRFGHHTHLCHHTPHRTSLIHPPTRNNHVNAITSTWQTQAQLKSNTSN